MWFKNRLGLWSSSEQINQDDLEQYLQTVRGEMTWFMDGIDEVKKLLDAWDRQWAFQKLQKVADGFRNWWFYRASLENPTGEDPFNLENRADTDEEIK